MTEIRFRVDIAPGCSIGPGKIALLENILETGSLSAAARRLGMSYRRAWLLLDSVNRSFRTPLAAASVGGRGGGGVEITVLGRRVIAEYRRMERDIGRLAATRWRSLSQAARGGQAAPGRSLKRRSRAVRASGRGRGSKRP
jgi:molybdate transport system regulatory protein